MGATILFALLGGVCAVVAWREWTDKGSAGRLGHPLLIPLVLAAIGALIGPMSAWMMAVGLHPVFCVGIVATLTAPFGFYFAAHLANVLVAGLSGAPSMPVDENNPFKAAQRAIRIGTLDKAIARFNKWGRYSLLFAWLPVIGDPITFAAGVLRTSFFPFIILVVIGKGFRYLAVAFGVQLFIF